MSNKTSHSCSSEPHKYHEALSNYSKWVRMSSTNVMVWHHWSRSSAKIYKDTVKIIPYVFTSAKKSNLYKVSTRRKKTQSSWRTCFQIHLMFISQLHKVSRLNSRISIHVDLAQWQNITKLRPVDRQLIHFVWPCEDHVMKISTQTYHLLLLNSQAEGVWPVTWRQHTQ